MNIRRIRGVALVLCIVGASHLTAAQAGDRPLLFARFLTYVESKLSPPWPGEPSKLTPPRPRTQGRLSPPIGITPPPETELPTTNVVPPQL